MPLIHQPGNDRRSGLRNDEGIARKLRSDSTTLDKAAEIVGKLQEDDEKDEVKALLDNHGADLPRVISNLVDTMENCDTDSIKFKALETALRMHGVLDNKNPGEGVQIIFNVQGDKVQMNNILIPRR